MRFSLRFKYTLLQIFLLVVMTVVAGLITSYEMQKYYKERIYGQVRNQLYEVQFLLAHTNLGEKENDIHYPNLRDFARSAGLRLTLMDSVGAVRFDSELSVEQVTHLANHLQRPEIQGALSKGLGYNTRFSTTLNESMYYAALHVEPQFFGKGTLRIIRFIRIALPATEIDRALAEVRWKIFGGGALALLLMALFSFWAAQRITHPLQKLAATAERVKAGDWEAHFEHHSQDELGKLADLLNEMLAKLRQDLIQLRKLEQVRTQFLGNVSHELRTPIFAVQGYLETMMHNKIRDPQVIQDFIARAHHQTVRLNNLLMDLIDISRIESGEMKMSFKVFNVHAWLTRQVEELQEKAKEYQVTFSLHNKVPSSPILVLGDQERLAQVIVNLVENAIKYNQPEGWVTVGYEASATEVEIYVQDAGWGIPAEHLPRIFERFYRIDKERSRSVGGTGLGLAIVKHIVEAHGSQVQVSSTVGKGSRFQFRLKR
jgi:two-component system, OmpR family, phosphate regulon sensor histidine kinase PhoR